MIGVRLDVCRNERLGEARPAGTGVELVSRTEKRLARDDIDINAGLVVVPVLVMKRGFSSGLLRDFELFRRQSGLQLRVGRFGVASHCCTRVSLRIGGRYAKYRSNKTESDAERVAIEFEH